MKLGREFGWLWAAYAVSSFGTRFAFGAFPLIAIVVLHAGPGQVSALAAAGLIAGAAVALPLGPWLDFRRKRPVMIATDLVRFAALASVPAAYLAGLLGFTQLLVVAVITAAADTTFQAASGAYLKTLVPAKGLLAANSRFESTTWTALVLGPPLGGAVAGLAGPIVTLVADAVSYLLSALGLRAIGGVEPRPPSRQARFRAADLVEGWRFVLGHPVLRRLFANTLLANGLIMATSPLIAVLMLGELGFPPWQYGLAFALPCLGGLLGAWLSPRLVGRFGRDRVLVVSGTLRACWPVALAFVQPGLPGLLLVVGTQFALITCIGVYNPLQVTYRLEQAPADRVARVLSAWSVSSMTVIALMTALWGALAAVTGARVAVGVAGVLLLATPLLLPKRLSPAPAGPAPVSSSPG